MESPRNSSLRVGSGGGSASLASLLDEDDDHDDVGGSGKEPWSAVAV